MEKTIRNKFIEIASNYIGEIKEEGERIWIENKNKITSYYQSGEIHRQERVLCKVGLWGNSLFADEKTCAILGGAFGIDFSPDLLESYLKRYGFEEEEFKQMSFL